MTKVCKLLRIKKNITRYSARGSFISKMVDAGNNPYVVAEMAGNSPLTIYKHYIRTLEGRKANEKWSQFSDFILSLHLNSKRRETINELVAKINKAFEAFAKDAALLVEKGNKAAGTRARKASLKLEKLMKEFRKVSVEAAKN